MVSGSAPSSPSVRVCSSSSIPLGGGRQGLSFPALTQYGDDSVRTGSAAGEATAMTTKGLIRRPGRRRRWRPRSRRRQERSSGRWRRQGEAFVQTNVQKNGSFDNYVGRSEKTIRESAVSVARWMLSAGKSRNRSEPLDFSIVWPRCFGWAALALL